VRKQKRQSTLININERHLFDSYCLHQMDHSTLPFSNC